MGELRPTEVYAGWLAPRREFGIVDPMRSQCAVFIDAGYLLAAAATRVAGTSLRSGIDVDYVMLVSALMTHAQEDSGLPLLRANWYDSGSRPNGLPDWTQEQIGLMPRVKLRLGRRSLSGEQKGVDLRIGLDLVGHGRERVADVIYLVSGDDDLTEAVEEAQSHGIQVNLLVVPGHNGRPQAVAKHLQRAADDVLLIAAEDIDAAVKNRSIPEELLPRADEGEGEAAAADGGVGTEGAEPGRPDGGVGALPDGDAVTPGASATPGRVGRPVVANGAEPCETPAKPTPVTPSVLAGKKSTSLIPPKAGPSIAWSSVGGGSMQEWSGGEIASEDIDAVARQVIEGWCRTATPSLLAELRARHPDIPVDLDRALLMDLSTRSDVYDIPEGARYALRERFWQLVDRIRLG